jgi:hypothetical protein
MVLWGRYSFRLRSTIKNHLRICGWFFVFLWVLDEFGGLTLLALYNYKSVSLARIKVEY